MRNATKSMTPITIESLAVDARVNSNPECHSQALIARPWHGTVLMQLTDSDKEVFVYMNPDDARAFALSILDAIA